jgi:hypothetical protein
MAAARYYDESKSEGGSLPGVPLRDLSQEEFDALPGWLQQSVDASPMYRKTPLPPGGRPKQEQPAEGAKE